MSDSPHPSLTPRQADAWREVQRFWRQQGRPPTRQELGDRLGVRAQTADYHLRALSRKGLLELDRRSRGIELTEPPSWLDPTDAEAQTVPVVGRVAAGLASPAWQELQGRVPVPPGCRADFALRVQGQSMRDRGIFDGDLVLVEQRAQPDPFDVVVALLGEGELMETTVKTYVPRPGKAPILRAENPDFEDREVGEHEDFSIAGVVVGLIRLAMEFRHG